MKRAIVLDFVKDNVLVREKIKKWLISIIRAVLLIGISYIILLPLITKF